MMRRKKLRKLYCMFLILILIHQKHEKNLMSLFQERHIPGIFRITSIKIENTVQEFHCPGNRFPDLKRLKKSDFIFIVTLKWILPKLKEFFLLTASLELQFLGRIHQS